MYFRLLPCRFIFQATGDVHFRALASNDLRGALGRNLHDEKPEEYARVFRPTVQSAAPSGRKDSRRPFVLRSSHLNSQHVRSGSLFHFDLHLFDLREEALASIIKAYVLLWRDGIGVGGGSAKLHSVYALDSSSRKSSEIYNGKSLIPGRLNIVELPLDIGIRVSRIRIRFLAPTQLLTNGRVAEVPEFAVLYQRISERLSELNRLYAGEEFPLDFEGMVSRAKQIRISEMNIEPPRPFSASRKEGYFLGGIEGEVEYSGDLTEFLPYLSAAFWTGVGRYTVWGMGVIQISEMYC